MGRQRARVQLFVFLVCAVVIVALISMQRPVSSVSVAQAIPPEATASVTPLPTFTTLSVEVLAEHALKAARSNGFGSDLTVDDLDLSQAVKTTYDQLIQYDGDYVHYYGILNHDVNVPDNRPVAIIPISQVASDGAGESNYQRVILFLLYADNGDLLYTVEMGLPLVSAESTATPDPLVHALPPRDENGSLPLDTLLTTAYWTAKMGMPEDFTMEDMDLSDAVLTTYRQYRAFERGIILEKPPKGGPDMLRRPVFIMVFEGGDFYPGHGGGGFPIPNVTPTPTKYDKMMIVIWADTGQTFSRGVSPVGNPSFDFSPLKEYGLPFYIPTATPTPTP